MKRAALLCIVLGAFAASVASAQVNSGSDGSDHFLNVTSSRAIDLSLAASAAWNAPSPVAGNGVYDAAKWAVVFKYDSVYVAAGQTLTFLNHPAGAPVVWLVRGNVRIDGTVDLSGTAGITGGGAPTIPGPGGFAGGRGYMSTASLPGAGQGPGGGRVTDWVNGGGGKGGNYATDGGSGAALYGNLKIVPLMGGSGGSGGAHPSAPSGGAGGGAILMVSDGVVAVTGAVLANGGASACHLSGAGSGGAIRIVAAAISGTGSLFAKAGVVNNCNTSPWPYQYAGTGRIRLEANSFAGYAANVDPVPIQQSGIDAGGAVLWPSTSSPSVQIVSVAGVSVPANPLGILGPGDATISAVDSVAVQLACTNVPSNATVSVHVSPKAGADQVVPATFQSGSTASSTWRAVVPSIPINGYSGMQASVTLP